MDTGEFWMTKKQIYDQFTTAWKLAAAFCERPDRDDKFWHDFAEALKADAITDMAQTRLGLDLLHAVKDELERGGHA